MYGGGLPGRPPARRSGLGWVHATAITASAGRYQTFLRGIQLFAALQSRQTISGKYIKVENSPLNVKGWIQGNEKTVQSLSARTNGLSIRDSPKKTNLFFRKCPHQVWYLGLNPRIYLIFHGKGYFFVCYKKLLTNFILVKS